MEMFWDTRHFNEAGHLPEVLERLKNPESFAFYRHLRVLDLCIKAPGQAWAVPAEIDRNIVEPLSIAVSEEALVSGHEAEYCYVTLDQDPVLPGMTQRREGWHSDAYISNQHGRQLDVVPDNLEHFPEGQLVERTYVVYSTLPTQFADGPWALQDPVDCDQVLWDFNQQVEGKIKVEFPPFWMLKLDPYCVHACQQNTTNLNVGRTFLKIQFSSHKYNRTGNTLNNEIDYRGWNWVVRDPAKRAHRYVED